MAKRRANERESAIAMAGKGPRNDITDVPGLCAGSAIDTRVRTGVTVILPDAPAIVGGDVRGGGPGTRETDLLDPSTLVDRADAARANTTIGVVAVNASLTQAQARRLAIMAQDGLARAIRPAHGPTDGDVIFTLALGPKPASDPLSLTRLGVIAADCVARAIARAVFEAGKT
jgi:L-aminopeptidase/D-esterase-like protein